jgi:aspartyl/asparaginyl-tRNA synthetase
MRDYWKLNEFIEIHTPKLMATASESGAELFEVGYFNQKAYLAQSPQFYKQMAMASGFDRVFEIAPVFRANPSFTSRHNTEFTSVDVEISWVASHEDVMQFEERWIQHTLTRVSKTFGDRILETFGTDVVIPKVPFPRISMSEAMKVLAEKGHINGRGGDLDPAGERSLCEHIKEAFDHEFVFVTDYPFAVRPFYHVRQEGAIDSRKALTFSGKAGGHDRSTARTSAGSAGKAGHRKRVGPGTHRILSRFLSLWLSTTHGGFGFGLTRMLMVLLGLPALRDTTFLVRTPNRLSP